ncbi:MerR family transcriptional regulator [Actinomadura scrupuli]|uniref:MerR family transcriptional regulator n=1 Tax=Actinomadura scrupuli TaxID=559629 RepID=UPI003D95C039
MAELAGTTVRTVRYYHQIELLPVPGVRDGRRDYDLTHVARLIRIRWLTQAGVPLSRIVGMLQPSGDLGRGSAGADRESVLTDLNATVVALEEQLEQLEAQRTRVRRLITAVEQHDHLSPLPAAIARFYETIEQRARDDGVRRAIRRERDFMELAFYRGEMPPEVEVLYQGFDEARMAESIALFGQIADRYESASAPSEAEVAQIAAAVVERFSRHLGPELPHLARSVDLDAVQQAADLYVRLAGEKDRRLDRVIAAALLAAIEEARAE